MNYLCKYIFLLQIVSTLACHGKKKDLVETSSNYQNSESNKSGGEGVLGQDEKMMGSGNQGTDCGPDAAGSSPQLSLLSHQEYQNTLENALGFSIDAYIQNFAPMDKSGGFSNTVTGSMVSKVRVKNYVDAAFEISALAMANASFRSLYFSDCNEDEEACATKAIKSLGLRIFRSPLGDEEVNEILEVYKKAKAISADGPFAPFQASLAAMLMDARFLYHRLDIHQNEAERLLNAYELAEKLSFFLWQSAPDDALFTAAGNGELETSEGLKKQLDRMLQDEKALLAFRSYIEEWLELDNLNGIQRSEAEFPEFGPDLIEQMRTEIFSFFELYWFRSEASMMAIFDAPYSFAGPELAKLYGVPTDGESFARYSLESLSERKGVFSLAGIQANLSSGDEPSPVRRGLFFNSKFFCKDLPPPPPDAGAFKIMMELEDITPRERLKYHRESESCYACHKLIDPLGLAFENYDALGRYQGSYKNGLGIDPSGFILVGKSDQRIDFKNSMDLTTKLKGHEAIEDCFIKNSYQFATRLKPDGSNQCGLDKIKADLNKKDGSYLSLLRTIVESSSFRRIKQGSIGKVDLQDLQEDPIDGVEDVVNDANQDVNDPDIIVPVYRFYKGVDHLLSLDPNEGLTDGYAFEGQTFNVLAQEMENSIKIIRCFNPAITDNYLTSATCEEDGNVTIGTLGYLYSEASLGSPIYYCYLPGINHLATPNQQECINSNYQVQGIIGYAP